jgi:hypothetical protein
MKLTDIRTPLSLRTHNQELLMQPYHFPFLFCIIQHNLTLLQSGLNINYTLIAATTPMQL